MVRLAAVGVFRDGVTATQHWVSRRFPVQHLQADNVGLALVVTHCLPCYRTFVLLLEYVLSP